MTQKSNLLMGAGSHCPGAVPSSPNTVPVTSPPSIPVAQDFSHYHNSEGLSQIRAIVIAG